MSVVALAGGVGGAKLADGLAQVLPPERLTVVVNTGDDFEHMGLHICPDLDTVCYTLAGLANPTTGWGRASETWQALQTLRLVSVFRNGALSEAYGYDPVGNRTSSLDLPSWIYNERNELLSNGAASFTYDAAGNLATKTEAGTTWSYEWNAENQLTRVTKNGAEVARFSYDPLGRRIAITPGPAGSGPASLFVYDGEDMLRVVSREGKSLSARSFAHGPGIDEPLAYADTGQRGLCFFHADGLGNGDLHLANDLQLA